MSALPVHLDPNRWIHGSDVLSGEEIQRYWIPFGHGSRQCIGKNVAMMEVSHMSLPIRKTQIGQLLTMYV
jgi:cytochrome P450